MDADNKHNLQYFEASSMRELYDCMRIWQEDTRKRLLSVSVHKDDGIYCCLALTNPAEVVITSEDGMRHADVTGLGSLCVA